MDGPIFRAILTGELPYEFGDSDQASTSGAIQFPPSHFGAILTSCWLPVHERPTISEVMVRIRRETALHMAYYGRE